MSKVSAHELLVFQTAALQAHLSIPQLAKQLKMREHTVRRAFESLREKKVILGKRPYLNPSSLGLVLNYLYLSFTGTKSLRTAFVKALCDSDHVSYVGELGGAFQYEVGVYSRTTADLVAFFHTIADRFRGSVRNLGMITVHDEEYSGTRYLSAGAPRVRPLKTYPLGERVKIDETDHKILSALANGSFDAELEISRRLRIPMSTLFYRIKNLEKAGVISGYCYVCDSKPLGTLPLIMLVEADPMTEEQRTRIYHYVREHSQIASLNTVMGHWQIRLHARVQQYEQAASLIHDLHEKFENDISRVTVIPQLQFHKYTLYPFRHFDSVR